MTQLQPPASHPPVSGGPGTPGVTLPQVRGGAVDAPNTRSGGTRPLADRVIHVINLIRPAVQADGGDVELVEITPEKVVRIRLHGACVGCPSSTVTLQMGIERNLREHVPEVTGVEAVD